MSRKKTKTKEQSGFIIRLISWVIAVFLLIIALLGLGYYLGYEQGLSDANSVAIHKNIQREKALKKLQSAVNIKPKAEVKTPSLKKELHKVLKKEQYKKTTASHEYTKLPPVAPKREIVKSSNKPKLAIIIDDVSFKWDVKNIKSLGLPLTMSFLPPSKIHPDSAKLAAKEPYYMVHLPLEAQSFSAEEPTTLRITSSQKQISARIDKIKEDFPRVKYINNHTGSKFTSSEIAMNRLVFSMRKNGISFIDSRTTAATKVPLVMKNYGYAYIARDVFLDHEDSVSAIKKQIKIAIKKAKKYGKAIAIGHPHKNTLRALRESKHLFKEVQLVRIDQYI